MATKAQLRKQMLQMRRQLTSGQVQEASQKIADRFFAETDLKEVKYLHIFLSITEKNELDTWPIIRRIWAEFPHLQLVVPVTPPGAAELVHRKLSPETKLIRSDWGIDEPTNASPEVAPEQIDLVLVPLLAFDLQGQRVGYGKGFYDKFLEHCRADARKIGLSVFAPVEQIEDTGSWDIPLDSCLTPDAVFRFGA